MLLGNLGWYASVLYSNILYGDGIKAYDHFISEGG